MSKPQREMEDPLTYAHILMRKLGMDEDKTALREAEDAILEAMNEALDHARDAVQRSPRWGVEAIDSLKAKLNTPR